MKKLLFIALFAAGMAPRTNAQTAEQKALEAYAKPGTQHKLMGLETGTWSNDMMFWAAEGATPTKATSACEIKMIMGGRYQEMNYSGTVMDVPFEGKCILAFDNATHMYTSTWIDNMGTGLLVMKGKASEDGKTIRFKGDMVNPTDGKTIPVTHVYTVVDDNTRKMEMYETKNGKEFKNMEITMHRN
jgi:hypothetical protein